MSNRTKKLSLLLIFAFVLAFLSPSCQKSPEPNSEMVENPEKNRFLYSFDVIVKKEEVVVDSATGKLKLYLRLKHNFMPLTQDKDRKAGRIRFAEAEGSEKTYGVRFAKAPKPEKLSEKEFVRLGFGIVEVTPVARLSSGFNEIDIYGSGSIEIIAEIVVIPEEAVETTADAEKYLADLAYDGKIAFSYAVSMSEGNGKELYRKVEIKVPEKVITSGAEVFALSANL